MKSFKTHLAEKFDVVGKVLKMWSNPAYELEDIASKIGISRARVIEILKSQGKKGVPDE